MAYLDSRARPPAGLRARHARRFPHLVCRARAAVAEAPRHRGEPAPFLSRALGRHRQRLPHGAACQRHHRLHRADQPEAGRPDGPFARRAYRLPRRAAAARPAAQDGAGRARRRSRCLARSRRFTARRPRRWPRASLPRSTKSRDGDIDGALQNFVDGIDGEHAWRRLPAAAKQQLRDNIFTLLGQMQRERASPTARPTAEAIRTPTLLIGGADTTGSLATDLARDGGAYRRT